MGLPIQFVSEPMVTLEGGSYGIGSQSPRFKLTGQSCMHGGLTTLSVCFAVLTIGSVELTNFSEVSTKVLYPFNNRSSISVNDSQLCRVIIS